MGQPEPHIDRDRGTQNSFGTLKKAFPLGGPADKRAEILSTIYRCMIEITGSIGRLSHGAVTRGRIYTCAQQRCGSIEPDVLAD